MRTYNWFSVADYGMELHTTTNILKEEFYKEVIEFFEYWENELNDPDVPICKWFYNENGGLIEIDMSNLDYDYLKQLLLEETLEYDLDDEFTEITKEQFLLDIEMKFVFSNDTYILPCGTELVCLDLDYVKSLEFDKIKQYLK